MRILLQKSDSGVYSQKFFCLWCQTAKQTLIRSVIDELGAFSLIKSDFGWSLRKPKGVWHIILSPRIPGCPGAEPGAAFREINQLSQSSCYHLSRQWVGSEGHSGVPVPPTSTGHQTGSSFHSQIIPSPAWKFSLCVLDTTGEDSLLE